MQVKIYTTPGCSYCTAAKRFFQEKGIKYTEYNVARDQNKAREMLDRSRQTGVPVIEINGKIFSGFNKNLIEQEIAKYV